jgi:hypothetical protein
MSAYSHKRTFEFFKLGLGMASTIGIHFVGELKQTQGKRNGQSDRAKTPIRYVPAAYGVQSMAIGAPGDPVAPTIGAGE